MTCGIYLLTFTNKIYYIGKSIDIQARYEQHKEDMLFGRAASKMQEAYKQYDYPDLHILDTYHPDHIDIMEAFYIQTWKPCLNTSIPKVFSEAEITILRESKHWLQLSTIEHIQRIEKQNSKLDSLKDTHTANLINENTKQGLFIAEILTDLNKLKKRSLWDRILNKN